MSNQTLNIVNNIVNSAEERGVAKLVLDNLTFDGKNVTLDNKYLIFFGSYSYLGLEVDRRLKEAAINAIVDYGIQYPSSRIYSSLPIYRKLENLISQIFNSNIVLTTSLSLGHIGVMPVIINNDDILILDQHVHSSVQDAAHRLRASGVKVTIVRHNDMDELEQKIKGYANAYKRIWYAIDGIYSMYGDTAPIERIEFLMNKYANFYVYADDAHGASSFGKNGSGWILSKIKLHEKMVLATGMAKAFGTMGGVFTIKDEAIYSKVKNCTGSLIFSGPHPIPVIGASIKSAEIHLTPEINERQEELQQKVRHCHELLKLEGIPDISDPQTPIFFIAVGQLNAGYNLVRKMIDDGYLTNLASFPAVSESCTGVRFTVTIHHTFEEIEGLVAAFKRNYPSVLNEENITVEQVRRAFRKVSSFPEYVVDYKTELVAADFTIQTHKSVQAFDPVFWDNLFATGCQFNWNTLRQLEQTFSDHSEKEMNWDFIYLTVEDRNKNLILATFFTIATVKEDMLSNADISTQIEQKRKDNKYYLSSKMLLMGTQITEGSHLYLNRASYDWKKALQLMLEEVETIKDSLNINSLLLRDFDPNDLELADFFKGHSFLKVQLPVGHETASFDWNTEFEFTQILNKKRRKYVRENAIINEKYFEARISNSLNQTELHECYKLYKNVNEKSVELNTFDVPFNLFEDLSRLEDWEFILLSINEQGMKKNVAMMLSFIGNNSYHPLFVGLDYEYLNDKIYPQMLWQVVKRTKNLRRDHLFLGYTASQNKRKFGANIVEKCAYFKSTDNYNQMLVNLI